MTVFVSGATGRVGGFLAQALMERGETVRTLAVPNDPNLERTRAAGIHCTVGDLTGFDNVREAIGDAETMTSRPSRVASCLSLVQRWPHVGI